MRQAAVHLSAIFMIISVVIAAVPLLPNGYYRIYTGTSHHPSSNRYFTAEPNARAGSVRLLLNSTSSLQVWRLHNHADGQVSLEVRGKKTYYLSQGGSGSLPGAYVGITRTQQKWNITKIAGGPFTRYALAYPRRVFGKTLLVSESNDAVDPKYVAFLNEDEPDTIQAWKFAIID